jgi:hypothetical protein
LKGEKKEANLATILALLKLIEGDYGQKDKKQLQVVAKQPTVEGKKQSYWDGADSRCSFKKKFLWRFAH